jgi:hypothetical protein
MSTKAGQLHVSLIGRPLIAGLAARFETQSIGGQGLGTA